MMIINGAMDLFLGAILGKGERRWRSNQQMAAEVALWHGVTKRWRYGWRSCYKDFGQSAVIEARYQLAHIIRREG